MLTKLLVTLPAEAVMVTVPVVWLPATSVTTPADTVAKAVLLDTHVATAVISNGPLHVVACASSETLGLLPVNAGGFPGVTWIDEMQPTVTFTVCCPVIVGLRLEVAVTVAVPVATEVTSPLALIVAIELSLGLILHVIGVLPVLPSLKVANAVICTVLLVGPTSMVGVGGPTARADTVGFTKNPRQLTAKARVARAAKAPMIRILCFVGDIFR
jgi:hypothetical protein